MKNRQKDSPAKKILTNNDVPFFLPKLRASLFVKWFENIYLKLLNFIFPPFYPLPMAYYLKDKYASIWATI